MQGKRFRFVISRSRELVVFATLAVALVLIRSFVAAWYDQFHFDSDQAIVGLMAKHLSEGRTFPLFYYGQHYMLGVQAWMAAPLFLLGGPTVLMLRMPLVILNCLVAVTVLVLLVNHTGLRPALSFVATLPFVMPGPIAASRLVEAVGASVELFLYVLLLWMLRRRPAAFGLVLAIGFFHREFTIFALPALMVVMAVERTLFTRATLEGALTVAVVVTGVWVVIDLLKTQVDVYGPATGALEHGLANLQMQAMVGRICLQPPELAARARSLLADCLPDLFGARRMALAAYSINSAAIEGSNMIGWVLPIAAILMTARLAPLVRRSRREPVLFSAYLALVGVGVLAAYPLSCGIVPGLPGILRYVLLGLLTPIALGAAYLRYETVPLLKRLAVTGLIAWAGFNLIDNLHVLREYQTRPPQDTKQALADYLVDNHYSHGRADHWDAYAVDFLSRERVVLASTGKMRIRAYEMEVATHRATAVDVLRQPCTADITFNNQWCIVPMVQGSRSR